MYLISHIIQVSLHRFLSNNRVHNVIKINLKDKKNIFVILSSNCIMFTPKNYYILAHRS